MKNKSRVHILLRSKLSDKMRSKTTSVLKNLKKKKMLCLVFKMTQKVKTLSLQTKEDLTTNAETSTDVQKPNMNSKKTRVSTKRSTTL